MSTTKIRIPRLYRMERCWGRIGAQNLWLPSKGNKIWVQRIRKKVKLHERPNQLRRCREESDGRDLYLLKTGNGSPQISEEVSN